MSNRRDMRAVSYRLADEWHMNGYDINESIGCVLYILVLLQLVENSEKIPAKYATKIMAITKVLYRPGQIEDISILEESIVLVEEIYNMRPGMLSEILRPVRFQEDGWKRSFTRTIDTLVETNLSDKESFELAEYLLCSSGKTRHNAMYISSMAVSDLLELAVDVKDGDKVLDGAAGCGYSALECILGKDVSFTGVDIFIRSTAIASLYFILAGRIGDEWYTEDFTAMDIGPDFDKVVMDIPFGMKTNNLVGYQTVKARNWMDTDNCREMDALCVAAGLDALARNGRMVTIVPQGFLFKQTKAMVTLRENIVKRGMLRAVVSLPAVYNSTSINTTMLVFEEGSKDTLFVDASSFIQRERRGDASITPSDKEKLRELLSEKKVIEGISFTVSPEQLLEIGDWSYSRYVSNDITQQFRSIADIDKDLDICSKSISDLDKIIQGLPLFNK